MKTSFSKALLFGAIATSFLMASCQKSTNKRSLVPNKPGASNTSTSAKTEVAQMACSVSFVELNENFRAFSKTIAASIAKKHKSSEAVSTLSEAEIADLAKANEELNHQCNELINEFEKMSTEDKKVEACLDGRLETEKKGFGTISIQSINDNCDKGSYAIAKVSGVESTRLKERALDLAGQKSAIKQKPFEEMSLSVASDEIGELLGKKHTESSQFIVNGEIFESMQNNFNTAKNDPNTSVCYVTSAAEGLEKGELLVVNNVSAETKDSKSLKVPYSISLSSGSKALMISCLIPNKKDLIEEFKKVFGAHLKVKNSDAPSTHLAPEAKAKEEAEAKAKEEAEAKAMKDSEEKAMKEAEEKAMKEAEEKAMKEAEEKAMKETEEKAMKETEEKAKEEAEAKAKNK